jgi:methyltransferase-like protein
MQTSDYLLFHDDLSEVNQPYFFADFMAEAHRHGLQFAAEANFSQMSVDSLPPDIAAQFAELGQRDLLAKEQYLDFMTCRSFRQTLLCHQEVEVDRSVSLERVRAFRISSNAREVTGDSDSDGVVEFAGPGSSALRTGHPAAIAALRLLGERYPQSVPFDELAVAAGAAAVGDAETLAEVVYRAYTAGVLGFHISEPAAVFEPSLRPLASPWARYRASSGRVVNLYHDSLSLDDGQGAVLALLDGEHTAGDIARLLDREERAVAEDIADFAAKGLLLG